jgi:hypothetical protein
MLASPFSSQSLFILHSNRGRVRAFCRIYFSGLGICITFPLFFFAIGFCYLRYKGKNRAKILEEVGDLVFSTVNIARLLDIDPEIAVNYTIDKFINRFAYIEENARNRDLDLKDMSLAEMDELWNESKRR